MNKLVAQDFVQFCKSGEFSRLEQLYANEKRNGGVSLKDARDAEGFTALHWCCLQDRRTIIDFLFRNELVVDVNDGANNTGQTPLHWACTQGHIVAADMIIHRGADVYKEDLLGYNAATHAVQNGHTLLLHYLKDTGMSLEGRDLEGHSLLHWAVYSDHRDLCYYLLGNSASLNAKDKAGNTPLHLAAMFNKARAAAFLVQYRAEVKALNSNGETPLQVARQYPESEETENYLQLIETEGVNSLHPLNSKRRRMVSTALPFIIYTVISYSLTQLPFWYIIPIFSVLGWLIMKYGYSFMWSTTRYPSPWPMYWAYATILFCFWFGYTNILSAMPEYRNTLIFLMCLVPINLGLIYKTSTEDPGTVLKNKAVHVSGQNIVRLITEEGMKADQFCPTCVIRKPIRSKHCVYCDTCIARFDHHCPWVNNCVGCNNHPYFVLLLVFWALLLFSFFIVLVVYIWFYLQIPTSPLFLLFNFIFSEQIFVIFCLMNTVVHFGWISFLLSDQVRLILQNKTLNEQKRREHKEYEEKFDRGTSHNIKEFLDLWKKTGRDWYHSFEGKKNDTV
ncbi:palmitoyltransferase ZDHHC17 [Planoprotostelium fungivorum]|uniref:Palmitoyltransferase n=1 Tax=Planoprotostelium fungivorum TaxID=1890364 RepID=A0A2P6N1W9_9EUKA|nr:palmitoyltransferase ZDHHC17 [Planoprotostelium fungivorum]